MPKRIDEDQLFETTVAVLAESGYRATTTQEIAARAGGVNEATLFRRYRAKGALINAALTHVLADSPFARVGVSADVTADLAALVRAYVDTADKYGGVVATFSGGRCRALPNCAVRWRRSCPIFATPRKSLPRISRTGTCPWVTRCRS